MAILTQIPRHMLLSREIAVPVGHPVPNHEGLRVEPGIERGCEKFLLACIHPGEANRAFVLFGQLLVVLHGAFVVDTLTGLVGRGARTVDEKEHPDLVTVDRTAGESARDESIVVGTGHGHDLGLDCHFRVGRPPDTLFFFKGWVRVQIGDIVLGIGGGYD